MKKKIDWSGFFAKLLIFLTTVFGVGYVLNNILDYYSFKHCYEISCAIVGCLITIPQATGLLLKNQ